MEAKEPSENKMKAAAGGRSFVSFRFCDCKDCRTTLHKPLVCVACKLAAYCSKECQTKAWRAGHKRECEAVLEAASQ